MNKIFQLILLLSFIAPMNTIAQLISFKNDLTAYNNIQLQLDTFERTQNIDIIKKMGCCPCIMCLTDIDKKNRYNFPMNNYRDFDSQKIHLGMLLIARVQKYPNFNYDIMLNTIKISKHCKREGCAFLRAEHEKQEILQGNYERYMFQIIDFFVYSNSFKPDDIDFFILNKISTYFPDVTEREIFLKNLNVGLDYYYPSEKEVERLALKQKLGLPIDRMKQKDFMEVWRRN